MKKGFTLVEVLVVVALLAVLTTASVAVFSRIRRQSRDSVRVVNITQMQVALRAFYRDWGVYPEDMINGSNLASGSITYMDTIPLYPQPVDGNCPANSSYDYELGAGSTTYSITFCLAEKIGDIEGGINIVTPAGITHQ
ncbi:MAG: prepilin-type N-terminal cleavage/methylation domain-containing protein [Patescibacteria group bacterium]|nr:prepilin-type N-terminal cleavage/methylation domain-containing protein [Patescibacteria group bacterium]